MKDQLGASIPKQQRKTDSVSISSAIRAGHEVTRLCIIEDALAKPRILTPAMQQDVTRDVWSARMRLSTETKAGYVMSSFLRTQPLFLGLPMYSAVVQSCEQRAMSPEHQRKSQPMEGKLGICEEVLRMHAAAVHPWVWACLHLWHHCCSLAERCQATPRPAWCKRHAGFDTCASVWGRRWGCKLSQKLFVGKEYVLKHIRLKHAHVMDAKREEVRRDLLIF